MKFINAVSTSEAKRMIRERFSDFIPKSSQIESLSSVGRVLGEDIIANFDVPNFNRSTVDGYAVKSQNTFGCSDSIPAFFDLVGSGEMGKATDIILKSGEAFYVPTGGMIPDGADAVCMIEYTEKLDDITIAVNKAVRPKENFVFKGDDIKKGEVVLKKGKRITLNDIGVLAALSYPTVKVVDKIKVAVISTGDEIVDIDVKPQTCQVNDINGFCISARLEELGCDITMRKIVNDNYERLKEAVTEGIEKSDIVILSGGSSVGIKDFTFDIITSFDDEGVFINGMNIKPGKPVIVGKAKGKAVFGLPGHPVSAITVFNVLVSDLIQFMQGTKKKENWVLGVATTNFHSAPGKETYQLVSLCEDDGKQLVYPIFGASGLITTLTKSDGYIVIPENVEGIYKGDCVKVFLN